MVVSLRVRVVALVGGGHRPGCAAAVTAASCHVHDYDDPGKPAIAWDDSEARAVLVDALVPDVLTLLDGVSGLQTDS